jgi:hypothetical protein
VVGGWVRVGWVDGCEWVVDGREWVVDGCEWVVDGCEWVVDGCEWVGASVCVGRFVGGQAGGNPRGTELCVWVVPVSLFVCRICPCRSVVARYTAHVVTMAVAAVVVVVMVVVAAAVAVAVAVAASMMNRDVRGARVGGLLAAGRAPTRG